MPVPSLDWTRMDEQLLRITLSTSLLAHVDRQLAREGSTRTRADFVREAVEQRLLELRFGSSEAPAPPSAAPDTLEHAALDAPEEALVRSRAPEPPLADVEDERVLEGDPMVDPRRLADTALPAAGH